MTYDEWVEKYEKETHNEHNVVEWHRAGYLGQGLKILNLEGYSGHGKSTFDDIKETAPGTDIDWCQCGFGLKADKLYYLNMQTAERSFNLDDLEEFGEFLKQYDIISVSQSGSYGSQLEELFSNSGAILVSSAGNDGFDGVTGKFKDIGFSIGAVEMRNGSIYRESYSAVGEKLDFVCFHYEREGTSFSAPVFAGLCALVLSKYPNVNKYEMYEVMKSLSLNLGELGHDEYYGHGLPVLPEDTKIEMLENIMGIPLIQKPITNFTNRESYPMSPEYITIHNFGTDHKTENVANYIVNTNEVKSWHFTVGANAIYQHLPLDINGWHAGCGEDCDGNRKSIAIEIEETEEAMRNAIKLVAYLRLDRELEIKTHQDWSRKYCPRWILNYYSKDYFIKKVEKLEMEFKDVEKDRWSYKAIDYVSDKGYMNGYKDGTFKPSEPLTREELAQVLYNIENKY